jgi:hypothetical protein
MRGRKAAEQPLVSIQVTKLRHLGIVHVNAEKKRVFTELCKRL